jgi:four helix bundle protein
MKDRDLSTRLRAFAARVVRLVRDLPKDHAAQHIARQLVRSATGGGSNYQEARGAESLADFIRKLAIANKEVREALYWLELALDVELSDAAGLRPLVREADELVAILTSSINTSKRRQTESRPS